MEFLDEHIKETKDKKDVIKKRPLCRAYMEWFREEVGGLVEEPIENSGGDDEN